MAKTLADIQRKIQLLEKQAQEIRSREVSGVIARIREAIEHYELSAEDLFGKRTSVAGKRGRGAAKKSVGRGTGRSGLAAKKVPIKYRDDSGNTWTGRGLKPRWLTAALTAGKTLEDFKV